MANMNFLIAFDLLMELEGGLVNDKDDSGGLTKFGIAKRSFPGLDIEKLTIRQAKEIYFAKYWKPAKCGLLPAGIDVCHFCFAVNTGVKRASRFLQRSINTRLSKKLVVDGIIGKKTLDAVFKVEVDDILVEYNVLINLFYARLAFVKGKKKFLKGWLRRQSKVFHKSLLTKNIF